MKRKIFVRGQEPDIAMESGIFKEIGIWLRELPSNTSTYVITRDIVKKVIKINVVGDVVLENFDIVKIEGIRGIYKVEFVIENGQITKLYELSTEEIYSRIREYYKSIFDKCKGKTIEDQYDIIFGETEGINRPIERIEDREELIKTLPDAPNDEKLKEIAQEILVYKLEYTRHAKDKLSVEMEQYAKELLKRLKKS